jgi:hypothetical protein
MTFFSEVKDPHNGYMRDGLTATHHAADAAKLGADTATSALNMANRPRLVIRHIVVDGIDSVKSVKGSTVEEQFTACC